MRGAAAAPTLSVPAAWAIAALYLATASLARAETADERNLRDHAAGNDLPAVQTLLARGTNPNAADHDGRTAVHHAANIAKAPILEALLLAGGDPDAQDAAGSTPLHLAADFPYFEPDSQLSVRVLLAAGANPGLADRDGRTPLHLVAQNHEESASVRDLLARGADANATDHRGDTPLHHAVGRGSPFSAEVVEALVAGGARGDAAGGSGETPLQLFVRVGSSDGRIVHALVAGGAHPDGRNPDGETPLHTAIRNGGSAENPEVVEALLSAGADPCLQDAGGYIPYHTARESGDVHHMLSRAGGSDFACEGRDATAELDADVVRSIQAALSARGYDPGPADGVMGAKTRASIEAWQDAMGFPATGDLTSEELDLLLAEVPSSDVAAGPPGQLCSGTGDEDACWMEVADREGCYLWKFYPSAEESVTWSGDCPGGRASGSGTEVRTYRNWDDEWATASGEGAYLDGIQDGRWRFRYDGGGTAEGSFVDGQRHGHWVTRWGNGDSTEGSFVDGQRHGHWVERWGGGNSAEGPYADGQRHGHWVERWGTGGSGEGPYADGQRHGHWILRWSDGKTDEGSYVDDQRVGRWTKRSNGDCHAFEYSYGESMGTYLGAC